MSDYAAAVRALKDRLAAGWATTPILFENEGAPVMADDAGNLTPWIECLVLADSSEQMTIGGTGNRITVDEGVVSVTVFTPAGMGTDLAYQRAVTIGEIMGHAVMTVSGRRLETKTPLIGQGSRATSENPEGVWHALAVTVPFSFYRLA